MSLLGNLTVGILGNASGLSNTFRSAQSQVQQFGRQMQDIGSNLFSIGGTLTAALTVPIVGMATASVKSAIDFESAFAGVRKTVDATEKEFATFRQEILNMSKTIPASATEIAKVAEAAGQLGIKKENIMGFTRTMVDLGVATNMSSDEAATALARLANITGMPQSQFDRLGSTIVALGNNLATTESEITEMGLRLAGAGNQVNMSEAQILSFAGALSSVGINAEAGGSAFSRVFLNMNSAVASGGKELESFAKVAGMSGAEFKKAFQQDAAQATIAFIKGLDGLSKSGADLTPILKDLGLNEIVVRDALMRAAGASDVFADALKIGSKAWEENNALTNEAKERYKTTESQLKILWNRIKAIGITIGDALIPALLSTLDALSPLITLLEQAATWFKNLTPSIQAVIIAVGAILSAVGPVLIVLGTLISSVGSIAIAFGKLSPLLFGTAESAGLLGTFMTALTGPIGIAIAAISGIGAALVTLYKTNDEFREKVDVAWSVIKDVISAVITEIQAVITQVWGAIKDFWNENQDIILTAAKNVWETLGTVINVAMASIMMIFKVTWPVLQEIVSAAWEVIKTVIGTALDIIGGIIKVVMGLVAGDWQAVWDGIKQIISAVWDGIISIVDIGINLITNFITLAWNTIFSVTLFIWDGIKSFLSSVWDSIVLTVTSVWDGISAFFSSILESIYSIFSGQFNAISSFISTTMDSILTIITNVWDLIKNVFLGTILIIVDLITGDFGSIKSHVSQIMNNVQGAINTIWEAIKGIFKSAVETALTVTKENFNLIKSTITNIFSNVLIFISNTWETIKTTFINALVVVVKYVFDKFTEFKTTVTNKMNETKTTISNIWDSVMSFFKGINLTQIGKDIMQGLINGIGSMASAVWDKAKSIANGIGDAIKSALDIHSPSRVAIWLMEMFGVGMIKGMDNSIAGIMDKAKTLADAAIPEFPSTKVPTFYYSSGGSSSQKYGFGGITQNITINSPDPTSPSENARKMKQASQQLAMEWGM